MATDENLKLTELLELANHYPSPYNGQPIELKQLYDHNFGIYFQIQTWTSNFQTRRKYFWCHPSQVKNDYVWNIDHERAKAEGIV